MVEKSKGSSLKDLARTSVFAAVVIGTALVMELDNNSRPKFHSSWGGYTIPLEVAPKIEVAGNDAKNNMVFGLVFTNSENGQWTCTRNMANVLNCRIDTFMLHGGEGISTINVCWSTNRSNALEKDIDVAEYGLMIDKSEGWRRTAAPLIFKFNGNYAVMKSYASDLQSNVIVGLDRGNLRYMLIATAKGEGEPSILVLASTIMGIELR